MRVKTHIKRNTDAPTFERRLLISLNAFSHEIDFLKFTSALRCLPKRYLQCSALSQVDL